jgi:glycosyltransferase involved in cell wall biosynthesis
MVELTNGVAQANALYRSGQYQQALSIYELVALRPGWAKLVQTNISFCRMRLELPIKLSVIVPVFNTGQYLEKCLQSILNQTEASLEIIVINDGSSDNSLDIIERMMKEDKRIVLINNQKPSGNPGTPRNQGIAIANGKYLGFVDSDDWVDPDFFACLLAVIEKGDLDIAFAAGYTNHRDAESEAVTYDARHFSLADSEVHGYHQSFAIWDKVYRTSGIKSHSIELGETKAAVDVPFILKAYYFLKKAGFADTRGYHYRRESPSSVTVNFRKSSNCDFEIQAFKDMENWCLDTGVASQYQNLIKFRKVSSYIYTLSVISTDEFRAFFSKIKLELSAIDSALIANLSRQLKKLPTFEKFKAITTGDAESFLKAYRADPPQAVLPVSAPAKIIQTVHTGSALAPKSNNVVEDLYVKLMGLGFTDLPLAELESIANGASANTDRVKAFHILALWYMSKKNRADYLTALKHLKHASAIEGTTSPSSELSTATLICHFHLGEHPEAKKLVSKLEAVNGLTPDALLAWVNFQPTPEARIGVINRVLAHYKIPELSLRTDSEASTYDRLQVAGTLDAVLDGPKVTVLVAAYEAAATLPTTLRSLQQQTWKNLEIIVLDDHSPSLDTVSVAERFAQEDSRIKVVWMPKNGGAYVARNYGLEMASGEFVTLNDADDWSHPLKIETQVRFLLSAPNVVGCTSQQARATPCMSFHRFRGRGVLISNNVSSFMFHRALVMESVGFWDSVRFGADSEYLSRIQAFFGKEAIAQLKTGPLSFQRDSEEAITNDECFGWVGTYHGARQIYFDVQRYHHAKGKGTGKGLLRYEREMPQRPFPVPKAMLVSKAELKKTTHFDVVIASEFRMGGGSIQSNIQEIACQTRAGLRTGILSMFFYDLPLIRTKPEVFSQVDGENVQKIVYGENVSCDLLIIRYPPVLYHRLRYMPHIEAKEIRVIVNQPPMSDYGPNGVVRYKLEQCAENLRHYFGKDAIWHPIGPLVREALFKYHAADLKHIKISEEDWFNIIDIGGWNRSEHKRAANATLRIGRHSRDHESKWPQTRDEILAAYPDNDSIEVHILGGADTPSSILGGLPSNWTVHKFGSMRPKDFLSGIDVFVYFTSPSWVESFGRVIIEAMAVGVPVILPEIYRPLFADAAIYATPQTAVSIARKLYSDSEAYSRQVNLAQAYVRKNFSYESHIMRLKKLRVAA